MAAKKATKAKAPRKSQSPIADRIIEASMKIASEQGWQSLTLNQIADTIGEPLGAVIGVYPTTDRIASALFHRIDQQVLSQVDDVDESGANAHRVWHRSQQCHWHGARACPCGCLWHSSTNVA